MDLMNQIDLFPLVMLAMCQKWNWENVFFLGAFFKVVTITDDTLNKAGTLTKKYWEGGICKDFQAVSYLFGILECGTQNST